MKNTQMKNIKNRLDTAEQNISEFKAIATQYNIEPENNIKNISEIWGQIQEA